MPYRYTIFVFFLLLLLLFLLLLLLLDLLVLYLDLIIIINTIIIMKLFSHHRCNHHDQNVCCPETVAAEEARPVKSLARLDRNEPCWCSCSPMSSTSTTAHVICDELLLCCWQ